MSNLQNTNTGGKKVIRSYFRILLAQKEMREGRTISLREVSRSTETAMSLLTSLAQNSFRQIPTEALARLCDYLDCQVGDMLKLEDMEVNHG